MTNYGTMIDAVRAVHKVIGRDAAKEVVKVFGECDLLADIHRDRCQDVTNACNTLLTLHHARLATAKVDDDELDETDEKMSREEAEDTAKSLNDIVKMLNRGTSTDDPPRPVFVEGKKGTPHITITFSRPLTSLEIATIAQRIGETFFN